MFQRAIVVVLAMAMLVPLGQGVTPSEAKGKFKTVTRTFSNPTGVNIVTFETHSSQIAVNGLKKGRALDVNVTLHGFSHTLPDDVNVLLVAPDGHNAIIMSDAGATNDANNLTLTFDDEAGQSLPDNDQLVSGTFKPTNFDDGVPDMFINPNAPTPSGAVALATFDGINPNGAWTLYIYDDNAGDNGTLAGGWSLQIRAKVKK
jgi:subtilisin-like proprotein convertase family protein